MAIRTKDGWACSICGSVKADSVEADSCRDSHNIMYVPLTKEELNRLVQFIYLLDEELLTPELVEKLKKYVRASVK